MQSVLYVDRLDQAGVLLKPLRLEIVRRLAEPRSCPELGAELGESTQKVYYHVKALESAGLIDRVAERRVRGIMEGVYQARARSYWLSPGLVGRIGGAARARDELSLGFLLTLAEDVQEDIARLGSSSEEVPSVGLDAEIELRPEQRAEFLRELREAIQTVLARFGDGDGERFRVAVACYPRREERDE